MTGTIAPAAAPILRDIGRAADERGRTVTAKLDPDAARPADRTITVTRKVKTPFGSMYVHVQFGVTGRPCGGSISDPRKEPDAQIAKLVEALAAGLDEIMRNASTDLETCSGCQSSQPTLRFGGGDAIQSDAVKFVKGAEEPKSKATESPALNKKSSKSAKSPPAKQWKPGKARKTKSKGK